MTSRSTARLSSAFRRPFRLPGYRHSTNNTKGEHSMATTQEEGAVPDFLRMDQPVSADPANAKKTGNWHGWPTKTSRRSR